MGFRGPEWADVEVIAHFGGFAKNVRLTSTF
jgi:hypothetical protein